MDTTLTCRAWDVHTSWLEASNSNTQMSSTKEENCFQWPLGMHVISWTLVTKYATITVGHKKSVTCVNYSSYCNIFQQNLSNKI